MGGRSEAFQLSETKVESEEQSQDQSPTGTQPLSPYIADSLRKRRLEAEQDRILAETLNEIGIPQDIDHWGNPLSGKARAVKHRSQRRRQMRRMISDNREKLDFHGARIERIAWHQVVDRDGYICYLCGIELDLDEVTLDHVIPISKGGDHTLENVRVCCRPCNLAKGSMMLSEYLAKVSAVR